MKRKTQNLPYVRESHLFILGKSFELESGEMSAGDLAEVAADDEVEVDVPEVKLPEDDLFFPPIALPTLFALAFSLPEVVTVITVVGVGVEVEVTAAEAEVGTLGVLTGSMGELVREREPKNRSGFSGEEAAAAAAAVPDPAAFEEGTGCAADEAEF